MDMSNTRKPTHPMKAHKAPAKASKFYGMKTNGGLRREIPVYDKAIAKQARRAARKPARNARRAGRR